MRKWLVVEIVRRKLNSKGETLKKFVSRDLVFSSEADCVGIAFRRSPSPAEEGLETKVHVRDARTEDTYDSVCFQSARTS